MIGGKEKKWEKHILITFFDLHFPLPGISPIYPQEKDYLLKEKQRGDQERMPNFTFFFFLHPQFISVAALESVSLLDMVEPLGHLLHIPPNQVSSVKTKTNHKNYTPSPRHMGKI